ncbi:glutathione S-transferase family protein [Paucibacter sp. B2R-40]|uniref:glutathione S-transferase family protein n=1 Tax=Paucibacter sp. B2R-40 TaxID=2893554 RepID=UPI0021E40122|nr:glutathione S-transferase family protein [Paucibacter sp. B2R-40]MCV2352802.1 glutathione S-transferase family protein [Paucibacter sp. B2R-40]
MSGPLLLVSHLLCPYVQRVAIVLAEKGLAFERRDINLANKPDWFLKLSPLGKTPLLLDGDAALFESAVICEYLDETALPRLHPSNALLRAQHRAWMEFGSTLLTAIAGFYNAPDEAALAARGAEIRRRFEQLEAQLGAQLNEGPYFAGPSFSIVDAVFAPVWRYFDVFDKVPGMAELGWWDDLPKLQRWRRQLAARPSVIAAVRPDYPQRLQEFLLARQSALAGRMLAMRQ